jgi:uncharacterized protein
MKRFFLFAAVITALVFPLAVTAQVAPPQQPREPFAFETIVVTGHSRESLTPDQVSFSVGVQTFATTADGAVRENNQRTSAIVAALRKGGATEKEIRTSNFSIHPQHESGPGRQPRIVGYQVSNMVTVTRSSVTGVGDLLQAAINAGANQIYGVNFTVADRTRGREQGLRSAFNDARAKAQVLAEAAGRGLGPALSIAEGTTAPPVQPYGRMVAMQEMAADVSVPVEPGALEVNFTVTVVFQLR